MSIESLKSYLEDTKLSQSKVASQLGVSPAVISQYLAGSYKGDTDKLDKAVAELIARRADKAKEVKADFVATTTAKKIMRTCTLAHTTNDIYLVIGEAGLGKTVALKQYAQNTSNVLLLEIDPTFNVKVLLTQLCEKLGITLSTNRTNNFMLESIVSKLKDSERLLIVDEAELLSYKCLEIIRRIHDKARIGVILAGMPKLIANLKGTRGEYKQLYSRVGFAFDMKNKLPDDDIALLCQKALGTDEFNAKLIKVSYGNARRLSKILKGIVRMAQNEKVAVNGEHIDEVLGMLID